MDDWEKFNKTSLPGKEEFYSHLDTEILLIQIMLPQKEFGKTLTYKF